MSCAAIKPAIEAIRNGEIIGLPTDTVYGIGADPMQRSAVERLFAAKQRPGINPIPILAATIEGVRRVAVIADDVATLAVRHWPGGVTLILPRNPCVPEWVGDPRRNTVGVRIPDHPTALAVLAVAGPLAVTSANRSAAEPAFDAAGARQALGDSVAVYLPGAAKGRAASTIVDVSGEEPRILREGPVDWVS